MSDLFLQTLQLGTLMERCKLLENGAVKLTTPQKTSVSTDSPNRSRFASLNRAIGTPKSVKLIEISVQTSNTNKSSSDLKTWLCGELTLESTYQNGLKGKKCRKHAKMSIFIRSS